MADERCVFPYSNYSAVNLKPEFPWELRRQGRQNLYTHLWDIGDGRGGEAVEEKRKKLTFRTVVRRIIVGRNLREGIEGSLKGRILSQAELPKDLENQVSTHLGWSVPTGVTKRKKIRSIVQPTIEENELSGHDVVKDEGDQNLKRFEGVYAQFMKRLDDMDEDDLEDMTSSGILTGLRSWLNFGSSFTPNQSQVPDIPLKVRDAMWDDAPPEKKIDISMQSTGPRSSRAAVALASMAMKGDDRLTRKAEEQAAKISGEFCAWLRELPQGEDDSVNKTSPEYISTLFDSAQTSNPAQSKLVEGLKSWAKFGTQLKGQVSGDWASMAQQELCKAKVKKRFSALRKRFNEGDDTTLSTQVQRRRKKQPKVDPSRSRLDHRDYGAWFMAPTDWNQRFVSKSSRLALEKASQARESAKPSLKAKQPRQQKIEQKQLKSIEEEDSESFPITEDDNRIASLHSTTAFAKFLSLRTKYVPPPFLEKILKIETLRAQQVAQQN